MQAVEVNRARPVFKSAACLGGEERLHLKSHLNHSSQVNADKYQYLDLMCRFGVLTYLLNISSSFNLSRTFPQPSKDVRKHLGKFRIYLLDSYQ